jgi:hypothetical protein
MFTLSPEPRWGCPVDVVMPSAAPARFHVSFRLLDAETRATLGETITGTDELLRRSLADATDVVDPEGQPIQFGPDLVEALIANPFTRRGLVRAYVEALAGIPSKAAAGN